MTLSTFLVVFLGGGLGCSLRYTLGVILPYTTPYVVMGANVLGGFLIGFLSVLFLKYGGHPLMRIFLIPGILGGFTTFSAFSIYTLDYLNAGQYLPAVLYIVISVLGALACAALGVALAKAL